MEQNVFIDLNVFKESLPTLPEVSELQIDLDEVISILNMPLSEILKCKSLDDIDEIIDKMHELEEEPTNHHEIVQFKKQLNEIMVDSEAYSNSFTGVF